jgi:NADPH-dependent curcumin reductase CurA
VGPILTREMKVYGFLISSILPKYRDEFYKVVPAMLAEGKLKYREHVYRGLESAGQGFYDIQSGKNNGKVVVVVADE